jgi:hypothetical protein
MKDTAQKAPRFCAVFSHIYHLFRRKKFKKQFFQKAVFPRDRRHFRDAAG